MEGRRVEPLTLTPLEHEARLIALQLKKVFSFYSNINFWEILGAQLQPPTVVIEIAAGAAFRRPKMATTVPPGDLSSWKVDKIFSSE